MAHTNLYSSSGGISALFRPLGVLTYICTHPQTDTHTHIHMVKNKKKNFLKKTSNIGKEDVENLGKDYLITLSTLSIVIIEPSQLHPMNLHRWSFSVSQKSFPNNHTMRYY